MVPLIPPFAILFGAVISKLDENRYWRLNTWLVLILPIVMTVIVLLKSWLATILGHQIAAYLYIVPSWLGFVLLALLIICIFISRYKGLTPQLLAAYFITFMFVMGHLALYQMMLRQDLKEISELIQPYKNEIAYAQAYRGEIGFIAKLEKPIAQISAKEVETWLAQHPNGIVILKYDVDKKQGHPERPTFKNARYIYEKPFRGGILAAIVYGSEPSNKK